MEGTARGEVQAAAADARVRADEEVGRGGDGVPLIFAGAG